MDQRNVASSSGMRVLIRSVTVKVELSQKGKTLDSLVYLHALIYGHEVCIFTERTK